MSSPTSAHVWPWPEELDAVRAAPASHRVLLENERVRVVEVVIAPGTKEPVHTHRWPSVMLVHGHVRIRYFGEDGSLEFESSEHGDASSLRTEWMGPEGPHAVENVDEIPYSAIRIEVKPTNDE